MVKQRQFVPLTEVRRTVMCQAENARNWWRLTPDTNGSSVNATGTHCNTAINMSRLAEHTNIAAAQRHYSWPPTTALNAVRTA